MNLLKPYAPKDGYVPLVKPGKDGIEYIEAGILRLAAGIAYRSASEACEVAIVLLGGLANMSVGETEFLSIGGRAHVFAGRATTVHIPPGQKFKVEAVGAVEAVIVKSPSDLSGEPRLIGPEKVKVSTRGKDACEQQLHDIIDTSFPSKRLVLRESFLASGRWSDFPPHKHDTPNPPHETRMEEVRFFKVNPPQGFGLLRVYSPEKGLDETLLIRDNNLVKLPFGFHPATVAPGYQLYSLAVLAGEPRSYTPYDDPEHVWVKEA